MSKPLYQDGLFRPDQEVTVVPRVKYPFAFNPVPDKYSKVYERDYNVLPTLYSPKIANRTSWTNLLTYSEDFTNAAWTKTALTPTISGTAPDGNATLNKLLETAANSEHNATQAATALAGSTFIGIFLQGGLTRTWLKLTFTDSASTVFSCFFDTNGNQGAKSAGVTVQVTPLGNSQYLVGFFCTTAAGAGTFKVGVSTDGSTVSYAGNTADGLYLWGAQVVTASSVPPYVKTVATTVTVSVPNCDASDATNGDPMAYLNEESDPNNITSLVAAVTRKYARVPLTQTVPKSIMVNRPSLTPSYTYVNFYSLATGLIATSACYRFADAYFVDGRAVSYLNIYPYTPCTGPANGLALATGGTFTFTYKTSTTAALNYNASNVTIAAAINALASIVSDGITVTASNNLSVYTGSAIAINVSAGTYAVAPTFDFGNLQPAACHFYSVTTSTSTVFSVSLIWTANVPSHGWTNTGQALVLGNATNATKMFLQTGDKWWVADANNIVFLTESGNIPATPDHVGPLVKIYIPASSPVSVNAITRFSLSAITPDTYQGDSYNLPLQIFLGNPAINYQVGDSARWPNEQSVIQSLTTIQVSAANL